MTPSDLSALGVLYFRMPSLSSVDALASERGYRNRDEITVSPAAMGDIYEAKVRSFFDEHLHEDEEIRYVRDGTGYFDVRGKGEEWIRIQLDKVCYSPWRWWGGRRGSGCGDADDGQDDLIILPAGIYHRFTTDEDNVSFFFLSFS